MTNKTTTHIPATYQGVRGFVCATMAGVLWWQAEGDTESRFFSYRRDGVWREFPGRADGPGLIIQKDLTWTAKRSNVLITGAESTGQTT